MTEKSREQRARRQLAAQGYELHKHVNTVDIYHNGCYQIVNTYFNRIEAGENYDLTIEQVEAFIRE